VSHRIVAVVSGFVFFATCMLGPAAVVRAAGREPAAVVAPDDVASTPTSEVPRRWHERLDGKRFTATVRLAVERSGWKEERRLVVWRDDRDGRGERLMARFESPSDLRGVGLLYLEHEGRPGDYFLYQPAAGRVRRIPETLAREDVYGVDLEYLGFGVAWMAQTEIVTVERTDLDGRPVWRVIERATDGTSRFAERRVWLDSTNYVPIRIEHWRDGERVLLAETQLVDNVQGVPTPRRVRFERPLSGERIDMEVEQVDYESPIGDSFFSAMRLVRD
jgi:hypothetical protein